MAVDDVGMEQQDIDSITSSKRENFQSTPDNSRHYCNVTVWFLHAYALYPIKQMHVIEVERSLPRRWECLLKKHILKRPSHASATSRLVFGRHPKYIHMK